MHQSAPATHQSAPATQSYTLIKALKNRRRQNAQATNFFAVGPNRSLYGSLEWALMRVAFLAPGFFEGGPRIFLNLWAPALMQML